MGPDRTYPASAWCWITAKSSTADSETVIIDLLDTFEPVRQALLRASAERDLSVQINLVISMYGEVVVGGDGQSWIDIPTPALGLSVETLRRLASFDCGLDVDQYIIPPD
ncbi:hypothetical protein AZH51_04790 [Branchiibius sp. NY16-3462-2]|nr:hypothetical protein AZH51_04790 [Branchiibius sp. NY16-3462-2]